MFSFVSILLSIVFAQNVNFSSSKIIEIEADEVILEVLPANSEVNEIEFISVRNTYTTSEEDGLFKISGRPNQVLNLKLFVKSENLNIFAKKANIDIKSSSLKLRGRFMNLNLNSTKSEGPMDLHAQEAKILISSHSGNLDFDLVEADLKVDGLNGNFNLSQFSGTNQLKKVDGEIQFTNNLAKSKIIDSKGSLVYENTKGDIEILAFDGEIRGNSQQGQSLIEAATNSRVVWRADQGGLRLSLSSMNGAYVDVASREGALNLVSPLRIQTEGPWRAARARLRGNQGGSISIRTNSADVRLIN